MSEQSNIHGGRRGRPRKTQEELALSRQRRKAYKKGRDSFRNKQAQEQGRQQLQRIQAIQGPEEEAGSIEIALLASTSSNIPFL